MSKSRATLIQDMDDNTKILYISCILLFIILLFVWFVG